jgi:hypothetical protein
MWCNPQSTLASVSLFSALLQPSWCNLQIMWSDHTEIGWHQLIFCYVMAKLVQSPNYLIPGQAKEPLATLQ